MGSPHFWENVLGENCIPYNYDRYSGMVWNVEVRNDEIARTGTEFIGLNDVSRYS